MIQVTSTTKRKTTPDAPSAPRISAQTTPPSGTYRPPQGCHSYTKLFVNRRFPPTSAIIIGGKTFANPNGGYVTQTLHFTYINHARIDRTPHCDCICLLAYNLTLETRQQRSDYLEPICAASLARHSRTNQARLRQSSARVANLAF